MRLKLSVQIKAIWMAANNTRYFLIAYQQIVIKTWKFQVGFDCFILYSLDKGASNISSLPIDAAFLRQWCCVHCWNSINIYSYVRIYLSNVPLLIFICLYSGMYADYSNFFVFRQIIKRNELERTDRVFIAQANTNVGRIHTRNDVARKQIEMFS